MRKANLPVDGLDGALSRPDEEKPQTNRGGGGGGGEEEEEEGGGRGANCRSNLGRSRKITAGKLNFTLPKRRRERGGKR